jgi:hypothetical protein
MMAAASLSTPKNAALRDEIIAQLRQRQPQTSRQLVEASTIAADAGDVMSILKPMIDAGDIQRAAPVAPGEPGGMTPGKGAKPVASYCLACHSDAPTAVKTLAKALPDVFDDPATTDPETDVASTPDPLIAQLHRLERTPSSLSSVDARRLRALAETNLFFNASPDWSLYLIGLADRIEDTL